MLGTGWLWFGIFRTTRFLEMRFVTLTTHRQWMAKWMIPAVIKITPAQVWIRSHVMRLNRNIGSTAPRPLETNRKYTLLIAVSKKLIPTMMFNSKFKRLR